VMMVVIVVVIGHGTTINKGRVFVPSSEL
jgi:hypothetical protein